MITWPSLSKRSAVAFVHDLVMAGLSFVLALSLRLGLEPAWSLATEQLFGPWLTFTLVAGLVFLFTGLYRGIWRYASLNDMIAIVRAVSTALAIFLVLTFLITRLADLPRSFLIINWFVLTALLAGPRMVYQLLKHRGIYHLFERDTHLRIPVVLIGAGDRAESFIRSLAREESPAYDVIGMFDLKGGRVGRRIHAVPVMGRLDEIESHMSALMRRTRPPQRFVLTESLPRETVTRLVGLCEGAGISLARLPRATALDAGGTEPVATKPVAIEDLLRRPETVLDEGPVESLLSGKRLLVTGAGGSIGSELVRQVVRFAPAELTLLDSSEYNLYRIEMEVREQLANRAAPTPAIHTSLCDVRDRVSLTAAFEEAKPEIVLHAAALKHVPIVEREVCAGVLTNVAGTAQVADLCRRYQVSTMVLVSTDKAVNPTNVMGATKRLAESYCQALDLVDSQGLENRTHFVTVRFGNVLGSTGSVVPLFQRQLERGGPLTVTHPNMTRYFMTVREAVRLVLQAAARSQDLSLSDSGMIYVLEMGEPVRILELAEQMIRLSGKKPYDDIDIRFTGLRPGEKMTEELFHDHEPLKETPVPGLNLAAPRTSDLELLKRNLEELFSAAEDHDSDAVRRKLALLVPEYQNGTQGATVKASGTAKAVQDT